MRESLSGRTVCSGPSPPFLWPLLYSCFTFWIVSSPFVISSMLMELFIVSPFFSRYDILLSSAEKTPPMFILCKTGGDVPLMTLFCGYVPQRGYFLPAVFRDCDGRM